MMTIRIPLVALPMMHMFTSKAFKKQFPPHTNYTQWAKS